MQSDAFPTPPIYAHHFQPRLVQQDLEQSQDSDRHLNYLLDKNDADAIKSQLEILDS